ncbi:THO complex subunit 2 [Hondaea fermentalgiana]|uniref:THO complex subunit 2 n=1 Tax=Hondaea fermentalgiana TaxID=2315210 RepID=A0A2R5G1V8_9STRA|nr:THO complex subunit 2 [Hondaea fermentalgiana]|eukprot:GBG24289.1 THO complex subunit 2 [Hondaea fermentalgiana]
MTSTVTESKEAMEADESKMEVDFGKTSFAHVQAPEHLVSFSNEFDKVRRSLQHSLEREHSYLQRIKELKARLSETNKQLKTRTAVAESLERQVKRLDEERCRAVRSETFALEREDNTRRIMLSLKQQVANLESRIHHLGGQSNTQALAAARQRFDENAEKRAEELLFKRTRQHVGPGSPFDQWKRVYEQWTPSAPGDEAAEAARLRAAPSAPRVAFDLYAATNPGRPHAHELTLANGRSNNVEAGDGGGLTLEPAPETPMQLAQAAALKLLTGHTQVDIALQRHAEVEAQARHVSRTVHSFLGHIREQAEASAHVTQSLRAYYAGSAGEAKIRAFEAAHNEVDKRLPDALLGVAQEHIVKPLDAYMNELTDVQVEIKTFHDRQGKFEHYEKKMYKLEEEHNKRNHDGKVDKPKQIEKLTRNRKKLEDARAARDEMISSLVSKLNYIYESRIATMDPILRSLFQFQQEFYKKCGEALQIELPENTAASATEAAANTTRPMSMRPQPVQATTSVFDEFGNRRSVGSEPTSAGSYMSSPPSSSAGSQGYAQTAPLSPPTNSGPQQPPRHIASLGSSSQASASGSVRVPANGTANGTGTSNEDNKTEEELVDKWFAV